MKISQKLVEKENLHKPAPTFNNTALMVAATITFTLNKSSGIMV